MEDGRTKKPQGLVGRDLLLRGEKLLNKASGHMRLVNHQDTDAETIQDLGHSSKINDVQEENP